MSRPLVSPLAGRGAGVVVLGVLGAMHWGLLLEPGIEARLVAVLGAGVALALMTHRLPIWTQLALVPGVLGLALAVGAGLGVGLLLPWNWGEVAAGLAAGLAALPEVRGPYAGGDEWVRATIAAGGGLLIATGAVLAMSRGATAEGRALALACLVLAFAVPVVVLEPGAPILRGLALGLGAVVFVWLERVPRSAARGALATVGLATLLALPAAAVAARDEPLVDYEAAVRGLGEEEVATFDWEHGYDPLDWPRTGRTVLRIEAPRPMHWKAENLVEFDGRRWIAGETVGSEPRPPAREEEIRVRVRGLEADRFIAAGRTVAIRRSTSEVEGFDSNGMAIPQGGIEPGDSYRARVIAPVTRPSGGDEAHGHDRLPSSRRLSLAGREIEFPPLGAPRDHLAAEVQGSGYERTFRLARELAAGVAGSWEMMRAVERHLAEGFAYDERGTPGRAPLDRFLFDERRGYCQQFAGSAALLLRMAGVPARVVSGFAPGDLDGAAGEWVVRDTNAHSWVEVHVAGTGWVTIDPTPAEAPALAGEGIDPLQPLDPPEDPAEPEVEAPDESDDAEADAETGGDGAAEAAAPAGGGGPPAWLYLLVGASLLGGLGVAAALASRPLDADGAIHEVNRALRAARVPVDGGATLSSLAAEQRNGRSYLEGLATARFGGGTMPSAMERRAWRRELARAAGFPGRVRVWLAMPPRRPPAG